MFSRLRQGNDHKIFEIYRKKWCYILLLHQTTTFPANGTKLSELCYIFLLHQTTTDSVAPIVMPVLCYIFLLHQTTTRGKSCFRALCCVISFFYIKPQQDILADVSAAVVLYLSSTSNHNCKGWTYSYSTVVLYLSSTSNHNSQGIARDLLKLCYIFLLHQTTTNNHIIKTTETLCYIFLLHQTTTICNRRYNMISCVISFFYIKPQLEAVIGAGSDRCVISFFYIKPQLPRLSNRAW